MTSAPRLRELDPRDELLCGIVARAIKKHQRAARRDGDLTLTQERIAYEVFGHNQQWLSRRLVGDVAFTPAELLTVGDWLGSDVLDWLEQVKGNYPGPGRRQNDGQPIPDEAPQRLTIFYGQGEQSAPSGVLTLVAV